MADTLIITAIIIYFTLFRAHVDIKIHGTYITNPEKIASFKLHDHEGNLISNQDFSNHWTLVFFGFTHCPMICPTTLSTLNGAIEQLKKELPPNQVPRVVFISVDPAQDTTGRLKDYVQRFNPDFIGARADIDKIKTLEEQLHLPASQGNAVNHSMEIIVVNPLVQAQAYFSYPHRVSELVADYKKIINKYNQNTASN